MNRRLILFLTVSLSFIVQLDAMEGEIPDMQHAIVAPLSRDEKETFEAQLLEVLKKRIFFSLRALCAFKVLDQFIIWPCPLSDYLNDLPFPLPDYLRNIGTVRGFIESFQRWLQRRHNPGDFLNMFIRFDQMSALAFIIQSIEQNLTLYRQITRLLKEHVDNVHFYGSKPNNVYACKPIHMAATTHRVIRALIYAGADVNALDSDGATPIIYASRAQLWDIVQLLISAGANVNARDITGATLLHTAVYHNSVMGVTILLHAGADVNALDRYGNTPLHMEDHETSTAVKRILRQHVASHEHGLTRLKMRCLLCTIQ